MDYKKRIDLLDKRIDQRIRAVESKTNMILKGKGNLLVRILDKGRVYLQNGSKGFKRVKDVDIALMVLEDFGDIQWVIRAFAK